MIIVAIIAWPILLLWVYFKFWKVTMPATGVAILLALWAHSVALGAMVTAPLVLIAFWVLRIQAKDRAIGERRAKERA